MTIEERLQPALQLKPDFLEAYFNLGNAQRAQGNVEAAIAAFRAAVRLVLDEVGAADVPMVAVYNKIDTITADERRRLRDADPSAALISATAGTGAGELLQMMASRLALDTRRVTITFDSGKEFDRQQIGRLYRVARVISHVATNGRVVIEADVPRRFIERLTTVESGSEAGE